MSRAEAFATKLPADLKVMLDKVCRRLGLRKTHVVETALREKLEDILDVEDLHQAIAEETRFHPWEEVKRARFRKGRG